MNIRKKVDYSPMFNAMRVAMKADMSQMKLYCELGRLIFQRTEKGAAVAAAEYLQQNYPDVSGLSPRNLRRMRDFYRIYGGNSELLDLAMKIGWTQNVVILEADLSTEERRWYLYAVTQFGWTKAELQRKIEAHTHLQVRLDESKDECYTGYNSSKSKSFGNYFRSGSRMSHRIGWLQHREKRPPCLTTALLQVIRLLRQTGPPAHKQRLQVARFIDMCNRMGANSAPEIVYNYAVKICIDLFSAKSSKTISASGVSITGHANLRACISSMTATYLHKSHRPALVK